MRAKSGHCAPSAGPLICPAAGSCWLWPPRRSARATASLLAAATPGGLHSPAPAQPRCSQASVAGTASLARKERGCALSDHCVNVDVSLHVVLQEQHGVLEP